MTAISASICFEIDDELAEGKPEGRGSDAPQRDELSFAKTAAVTTSLRMKSVRISVKASILVAVHSSTEAMTMTTAMHAEQAELERQLDGLKRQLERVRGRRFRSYGDDNDDARMIMCDHEGRAVFQIVTELNKVWNAMDKLKRTIASAQSHLQRLPEAPKPIARQPTSEASSSSSRLIPLPAPYFDAPPSGWDERQEFLTSILQEDLTRFPRTELRELIRNIELLDLEGLATEQKAAHRRASGRLTKQRVSQELEARPFDIVEGGAERNERRAQGLILISLDAED